MAGLTRNRGCHHTLGTDTKPPGTQFMPTARLQGPCWTGSRSNIGHDVHVCGFHTRPPDQWLGLFHCRGLEQRSPICVYREQKLPASSFQGDLTGGALGWIGEREAAHFRELA